MAETISHSFMQVEPIRERRQATRLRCRLTFLGKAIGMPEGEWMEGETTDLSTHGVGVVLAEAVARDFVLEACLWQVTGGRQLRPHIIRVCRVERRTAATWLTGCSFVCPLTPVELAVILREYDRAGISSEALTTRQAHRAVN